jgi:phosphoribosylformylglycinamidine synthase
MDLKEPGNAVYLLGETRDETGGSHWNLIMGNAQASGGAVPAPAPTAPALYRALHAAMRAGEVRACHDLSEGGLAVAAAEMCIGGRAGLALILPDGDAVAALFSESNGRLLAEVSPAHQASFEARFVGLPLARLGAVTPDGQLRVAISGQPAIALSVAQLCSAWLEAT